MDNAAEHAGRKNEAARRDASYQEKGKNRLLCDQRGRQWAGDSRRPDWRYFRTIFYNPENRALAWGYM